jgi:hypothetical protein
MISKLSNFSSPVSNLFKKRTTSSGPVGTSVSYTLGNYFDAFSSQSGVTTTDAFSTNNGCWQLYYAFKQIRITAAATSIGLNTYQGGSNSWTWLISVSSVNDTIGNFPSASAITSSSSFTYTAGGFNQHTTTVTTTIPANRYFLIGNSGGPFYRTVKSLASSRTAQVSGENYFTVVNRVFLGNWPSGGTTTIPTQLGGSGTGYTEYSSHAHVHSVKFNL